MILNRPDSALMVYVRAGSYQCENRSHFGCRDRRTDACLLAESCGVRADASRVTLVTLPSDTEIFLLFVPSSVTGVTEGFPGLVTLDVRIVSTNHEREATMTTTTEGRAIGKASADYYAQQSAMSDPGHHRALFEELQNDVRSLARIIHGLGIYDVVAKDFYVCDLSETRLREIHIRPMEQRTRSHHGA